MGGYTRWRISKASEAENKSVRHWINSGEGNSGALAGKGNSPDSAACRRHLFTRFIDEADEIEIPKLNSNRKDCPAKPKEATPPVTSSPIKKITPYNS